MAARAKNKKKEPLTPLKPFGKKKKKHTCFLPIVYVLYSLTIAGCCFYKVSLPCECNNQSMPAKQKDWFQFSAVFHGNLGTSKQKSDQNDRTMRTNKTVVKRPNWA